MFGQEHPFGLVDVKGTSEMIICRGSLAAIILTTAILMLCSVSLMGGIAYKHVAVEGKQYVVEYSLDVEPTGPQPIHCGIVVYEVPAELVEELLRKRNPFYGLPFPKSELKRIPDPYDGVPYHYDGVFCPGQCYEFNHLDHNYCYEKKTCPPGSGENLDDPQSWVKNARQNSIH